MPRHHNPIVSFAAGAALVASGAAGAATSAHVHAFETPADSIGTPTKPPESVVIVTNGNIGCSGVKVASHVVLTAKHCVETANEPVTIQTGSGDQSKPGKTHELHPTLDLATVCTSINVTSATLAMSVPKKGDTVRIGGFSQPGGWSGNTKVTAADGDRFVVAPPAPPITGRPCHADSGSPALTQDGAVTGIAIKLKGINCGGSTRYEAVAALVEWVGKAEQACKK